MSNLSALPSRFRSAADIQQRNALVGGLVAGGLAMLSVLVTVAVLGDVEIWKLALALAIGLGAGLLAWSFSLYIEKRSNEALRLHPYLEGIVRRAAEGICVCHQKDAFPFIEFSVWNDRMTEITGYTMEEINELGWYQALYPDEEYREKVIARMVRMRDGEDLIAEEWFIRRKDGQECALSISTSLSLDSGGTGHVLGLMNDVTEIRSTRKSLEIVAKDLSMVSGAELFEETLDYLLSALHMDMGLVGLLSDDEESVAARVVRTREGSVAKFVYDLANTPSEKAFEAGKCLYFDDVVKAFPEDHFLSEMGFKSFLGIPLRGKEGRPKGILVLLGCEEIRNLKLAKKTATLFSTRLALEVDRLSYMVELERAKERAEESDQLKSAFLANMSHEIRTPLNGIMGFAQLMQNRELDRAEQKKYLEIIDANGKHLLKLIGDLIEIAQIEARQVAIDRGVFDLSKMLKDLFADFKNQIQLRRGPSVTLILENDFGERRLMFKGDELRLRQVLYNLLNNAMKFTREGLISFGVTVVDDLGLEFWVRDTGIGIDESDKDRIFGRFHQSELTLTRNYDGSGLGLAICKGLVELMGGEIVVDSELGNGSIFRFNILGEVIDDAECAADLEVVGNQHMSKGARGFVVLAAEDNESNFVLLKEVLKRYSIELIWAKDGLEAVEAVKKRPDIGLILMDVRMPGIDGYEASRRIARIRPNLPIVIQTAFASKEDRDKAKFINGKKFLTKPIDPSTLISLVDEIIERRN